MNLPNFTHTGAGMLKLQWLTKWDIFWDTPISPMHKTVPLPQQHNQSLLGVYHLILRGNITVEILTT